MTVTRNLTFRAIGVGYLLACCGASALAGLGSSPLTQPNQGAVQTPKSAKAAILTAAATATFTDSTITLDSGTVTHEFVDAQNVVFAISWQGPVLPDFSALFGNYFSAYRVEVERNRAAHRRGAPIALKSDALVMSSQGRMGHFSGYAFVPSLVPAGVNIHDVLP